MKYKTKNNVMQLLITGCWQNSFIKIQLRNLKEVHANWVEDSLKVDEQLRDSKWSESIAVGSKAFVEKIKNELGMRAVHRRTNKVDESFELRETQTPYSANFSTKNVQLSKENSYSWDVCW